MGVVKARITKKQLEELKRLWADESEDPEEWEPETEWFPSVEVLIAESATGTLKGVSL